MATKKYLDDTGLSYFWSKVKAKIPEKRIFTTLIPTGTKVTGNLNTVNYLKVGTYYNNSDAEVKKLTNCPTTLAFMMEVYSPLSSTIDNESTAAWVYRLRVLTTYKGAIYYQAVNSGGTAGSFSYGSWSQVAKKSDIPNLSNYVTKSYAEEKYYDKYDIEQITKSDYSDTYTETFTSVTIPASSSVKVMDYPEDGDWNDNTTRILLVKEDGNLVDSTLLPVTCQSDGIYVKNTETESITVDLEITIANKKSFRNATVFYATCSSASSSTAKELVATNIPAPFAGMHLSVRFTYGFVNTPVSLFWNDTYLGEVVSSGTTTGVALDVRPDQMVELVYDGTYWHCLNIVEATTDYYGITRLTNSVTSNSTDTAATPKSVKQAYDLANSKQDALVSGTNIKTINGNSILGSGNIKISGGGSTTDIVNLIYPVGSIYMSVNSTNPKTLFGGTWAQIAQGRTLVGVDTSDTDFKTAEKTGGEKTHTLTKNELPQIDINTKYARTAGGDGSGLVYGTTTGNSNNALVTNTNYGGKAHNNLQPYFTCYIWKRTA